MLTKKKGETNVKHNNKKTNTREKDNRRGKKHEIKKDKNEKR